MAETINWDDIIAAKQGTEKAHWQRLHTAYQELSAAKDAILAQSVDDPRTILQFTNALLSMTTIMNTLEEEIHETLRAQQGKHYRIRQEETGKRNPIMNERVTLTDQKNVLNHQIHELSLINDAIREDLKHISYDDMLDGLAWHRHQIYERIGAVLKKQSQTPKEIIKLIQELIAEERHADRINELVKDAIIIYQGPTYPEHRDFAFKIKKYHLVHDIPTIVGVPLDNQGQESDVLGDVAIAIADSYQPTRCRAEHLTSALDNIVEQLRSRYTAQNLADLLRIMQSTVSDADKQAALSNELKEKNIRIRVQEIQGTKVKLAIEHIPFIRNYWFDCSKAHIADALKATLLVAQHSTEMDSVLQVNGWAHAMSMEDFYSSITAHRPPRDMENIAKNMFVATSLSDKKKKAYHKITQHLLHYARDGVISV